MKQNTIKLEGNSNIVLQDAKSGKITINANDPDLSEKIKQLNIEQITVLQQMAKEQKDHFPDLFRTKLAEAASQKNVVHGNISNVKSVKIGDEIHYHYHYPEKKVIQNADEIYNIDSVNNMDVSGTGTVNVEKAENITLHQSAKTFQKFLTNPVTISSKFWGREDILQQLSLKLNAEKQVALVGVKGIGGIGKTYVAAEFVQRYKDQYDHIVWLDYNDSLSNALTTPMLMQNLEVEFQEKLEDTLAIIKNKLENLKGKKLFILDNVTNIRDFYPEIDLLPANTWQILCTTRSNDIEDFENLEIGALPIHESRMLFCEHYLNIKVKNISAKDAYSKLNEIEIQALDDLLQNRIDFHTLSITLLAKTANSAKMTIADLNTAMKDENLDTQIFEEQLYAQYDRQQRKMFAILLKAFSLANINKSQLQLLKHYSLLPSSPIEFQNLGELLSDTFPTLGNLINELTENGWLEKTESIEGILAQFYRMHQILQEMVLLQQKLSFDEFEPFIKRVNDLLKIDPTKDNPVDKFKWVIFGDALLNNFNKVPNLYHSIETYEIIELQNNLALRHSDLGDYTKARDLLEKVLISSKKNFGEEHHLTVICSSNLACALVELGDYQEAKKLFEKALSDEQDFGNEYTNIVNRYSNLALVKKSLGDYKGAKSLLEKAVISSETNFGQEHPTTAVCYSNLALVLKDLGEYEGAKKLFEKVLISDEKNFGKEHPKIARTYSNLGLVLQYLGDYTGAKDLYQKAVISNENNFGEEHPQTAISYSNLGNLLKNLGDYKGAKTLLKKAIISAENKLGKEHPTTALRYSHLGLVLKALGDYTGAKSLFEKAVISDEKNLGKEHPNTAASYSNLALVMKELGDSTGVKDLLEKAMISNEKNFGKEHPTTTKSYNNLATVLVKFGDYFGAKSLFEKALISNEKNLGKEHPDTVSIYSNLALIYNYLGDFNGAKSLLEKVIISDKKNFGKEHTNTAVSYSNLALVLEELGDYNEALRLADKTLSIFQKILPENHPYIKQATEIYNSIKQQIY